jgi:MFS family permease
MLIESLTIVVAFPLFGMLSQRVGRRVFHVGYGFVITILGSAAHVAVLTVRAGFPVTVALTALVGVTVLGTIGPVAAYLTELFPSHISTRRASPRSSRPSSPRSSWSSSAACWSASAASSVRRPARWRWAGHQCETSEMADVPGAGRRGRCGMSMQKDLGAALVE